VASLPEFVGLTDAEVLELPPTAVVVPIVLDAREVIFVKDVGILVGVNVTPSVFVQVVNLPTALPVISPTVQLLVEVK